MSLDSYTNLKAEIADWLNRQDLTAQIPTFIRLTEAQVERMLRVREMITRSYATLTGQYIALPLDYLALSNVQLNTNPVQQLQYVTNHELDNVRARKEAADRPLYYSIVGDSIEVAPIPDDSYEIEIIYYAEIPKLTDTVQETNWLLDKHPDLYLYGSLMNAAPYLENDQRVQVWGQALSGILEDIRVADERSKAAGSPLKMRIKPYGVQQVS